MLAHENILKAKKSWYRTFQTMIHHSGQAAGYCKSPCRIKIIRLGEANQHEKSSFAEPVRSQHDDVWQTKLTKRNDQQLPKLCHDSIPQRRNLNIWRRGLLHIMECKKRQQCISKHFQRIWLTKTSKNKKKHCTDHFKTLDRISGQMTGCYKSYRPHWEPPLAWSQICIKIIGCRPRAFATNWHRGAEDWQNDPFNSFQMVTCQKAPKIHLETLKKESATQHKSKQCHYNPFPANLPHENIKKQNKHDTDNFNNKLVDFRPNLRVIQNPPPN